MRRLIIGFLILFSFNAFAKSININVPEGFTGMYDDATNARRAVIQKYGLY